jgi:hypothetical protein
MMSDTTRAILLGVFTLASCVWVGGYTRRSPSCPAASRVLEPAQRVRFFRALGRSYLLVGASALIAFFSEPLPGRVEPLGSPGGAAKLAPLGVDTELVSGHALPAE